MRDATGNADQHVAPGVTTRLLQGAQPAELGKHLLRSLLADMAGVEEDEVGGSRRVGDVIAFERQNIAHALGIVHVHLTAV